MLDRFAAAPVAVLGMVTSSGDPRLVPCCFAVDGEVIFTAVDDIKPKTTLALRRIQRIADHPGVSLLVQHYSDDWSELWWVRLDGMARVGVSGAADTRRGLRALADKYHQYRLQPPAGAVLIISDLTWRAWP